MKKLLWPLMVTLLFISCEKETPANLLLGQQEDYITLRGTQKIDVCEEKKGVWIILNISISSWPAHEAKGAIRLDDQDNDGFVPDNQCDYGEMGDCDDNDANRYPGNEEICEDGIDQDCDGVDEVCPTCCFDYWIGDYTVADIEYASYLPNGVNGEDFAEIGYIDGSYAIVAFNEICEHYDNEWRCGSCSPPHGTFCDCDIDEAVITADEAAYCLSALKDIIDEWNALQPAGSTGYRTQPNKVNSKYFNVVK